MAMRKAVRATMALVLAGLVGASLTGCIAEDILATALNTRSVNPGERVVVGQTFAHDGTWAVACSPGLVTVGMEVRIFGASGALAAEGAYTGADVVGGAAQGGGRVEITVENDSDVPAAVSLNVN